MKKIPFFSVVAEKQTYLNLVYILFAFPLSTIYFSLIITGVSLSIGLLIIIVGIFIFAATLLMVRGFRYLEIQMTEVFLDTRIIDPDKAVSWMDGRSGSFFNRTFGSGVTWKAFVYFLFIKFPLDIVIFSISISFIGICLHLLLAPIIIYYDWFESDFLEVLLDFLEDPYVLPFMGVIWIFITFHVINGLSWIYRLANPVFLKD